MSKENITVSTEWLTNTLTGYLNDTTQWRDKAVKLEAENEDLRKMREGVIKALNSIHEEDHHGNVKAYKYDTVISEIRKAVYPNAIDPEWEWKAPFKVVNR
ncbi:MAG: hypothetical protein IIY21_24100 [Clostridiales bacterium]|nr:hypothetical protein [Clostridiales bacterium]